MLKFIITLGEGIFENTSKLEAFSLLSEIAKKRGVLLLFSDFKNWNGEFFSSYFYLKNKKIIRCDKRMVPDFIHNRGACVTLRNSKEKSKSEKLFPFLNPVAFDYICDNKHINYIIFQKFYPKSFLVRNEKEFKKVVKKIKTHKIILKPNSGSLGEGIIITDKNNYEDIKINKKYFVQEFIDSSKGIPGICNRTHDLRVTVIGEKIIYVYVKIASENNLLCNVHQGGEMKVIPMKKVPKEVLRISKKIIQRLDSFENLNYSIDMARDASGKWKLIEMNGRPGLLFNGDDQKEQINYYKAFIDNFIDYVKKYKIENSSEDK